MKEYEYQVVRLMKYEPDYLADVNQEIDGICESHDGGRWEATGLTLVDNHLVILLKRIALDEAAQELINRHPHPGFRKALEK
jgi:hypothetical protein